jgi:hypothetical protein
MFPDADSPRYTPGGIALAVFCLSTAGAAITIRFALKRENRKLEAMDRDGTAYTGSLAAIPKGYRFQT